MSQAVTLARSTGRHPAPPLAPVRWYRQDQEIHREGAAADNFFKIITGTVRISTIRQDGRRHVDAFLTDGGMFGVEAAAAYRFTATALNECAVVSYRWPGVENRHADLSLQLCGHAVLALARAQDHACLLGRATAAEKLAAFLLSWSDAAPNPALISLAMSRTDIADYLGLTVETVSRAMTALRQRRLVEIITARQLRLPDLAALRAIGV
jgi:CRP/FNR family nitrogen fixation transcriptional regulator